MKNKLIAKNGSINGIKEIPKEIQDLYKTVWEIPQKIILDLAANRAPYIDQSQSLNVHMAEPSYSKMCSMHFYAWKLGLKTGQYYLRSRPAADPIKFTLDIQELLKDSGGVDMTGLNAFNQVNKKKRKKRVKVRRKRVKKSKSKKFDENNVEIVPENKQMVDDTLKENIDQNIEKGNVETDFDKLA